MSGGISNYTREKQSMPEEPGGGGDQEATCDTQSPPGGLGILKYSNLPGYMQLCSPQRPLDCACKLVSNHLCTQTSVLPGTVKTQIGRGELMCHMVSLRGMPFNPPPLMGPGHWHNPLAQGGFRVGLEDPSMATRAFFLLVACKSRPESLPSS